MSANDRVKGIAELETALVKYQRAEQALLERAAGDGIEVLPSPDTSPAAFLNVIVAKVKTAAA